MRWSLLDIFNYSQYRWGFAFFKFTQGKTEASLFGLEKKYDLLVLDVFFMDFIFLV